jgi:hypothetical protein
MAVDLAVAVITAVGGVLSACAAALPTWLNIRAQREQQRLSAQQPESARDVSAIPTTVVKQPRQFYIFLLLAMVLVALSILLMFRYSRNLAERFAAQQKAAEAWPRLVKDAQAKNLPYIMPHVTLLVTLQKAAPPDRLRVRARIVYSIQPLRDFDLDSPVFTETYSFAPPQDQQHWYGSDRELLSTPSIYQVHFQGVAGRPTTVVTGINALIRRSTGQLGSDVIKSLPLPPDAQVVSYANDADYIGELLLVVDSPDFLIESLPRGALRQTKSGGVVLSQEFAGAPPSSGVGQRSVCARWDNLIPGERVSIAIRIKS